MQGTRTSNRENDVLTQALGNKEHPGRTRGAGLVPWKLVFEEDSGTYRSRSRGKATTKAKFNQSMKEMKANYEQQIDVRVQDQVNKILASRGVAAQEPAPGRSSCGLTPLNDVEANAPHPIDNITEPISCRLYVRQQWTTDKVALGMAWPAGIGLINGRPIPSRYARVRIDNILHKKYNKIEIEYPAQEDRKCLVQNKGAHVF
jgi:hypothetical protein